MADILHTFHIPVMGTGHSVDTPIRVAHFGISSVISIMDDVLLEKIRKHYCSEYGMPYSKIARTDTDARAKRTTAYLDTVQEIVDIKMARVKALPFFEPNDKTKYFEMLPEESQLKQDYERFLRMDPGPERDEMSTALTRRMQPGSIDVNIMVKVDKLNYDRDGNPLPDEFSDARAALRGYANSRLDSAIVFSAGINKGLFSYMTHFRDFFRDEAGRIRKRIILKVSDFRSSLIQGRFLAKKGLEVHEYRIESGLNCGGHAFATNGFLLPCLVQEFKDNRDKLTVDIGKIVKQTYQENGWTYPELPGGHRPLVTVQGGIGCSGEAMRMRTEFGMDLTGWASPFLLVPEATCVDTPTRKLLEQAREKDLFPSGASPLGVPFNNVHHSGSEKWTLKMVEAGTPGSACPRQYLVSDREFSDRPICTASRDYQKMKLAQIEEMDISKSEKERQSQEVTQKSCLCGHLANGALITMGIAKEDKAPQMICPGPNIEWFDRTYSLKEMVDHIYGRPPSLVPANRPHMFAKEIHMYVDHFANLVKKSSGTQREIKTLREFKDNLRQGMAFCLEIAQKQPYPGENLASIETCVERESKRLKSIYLGFKRKMKLKEMITEGITPPMKLSPSVA